MSLKLRDATLQDISLTRTISGNWAVNIRFSIPRLKLWLLGYEGEHTGISKNPIVAFWRSFKKVRERWRELEKRYA
jgi:hypothetical protein